MNISFKEETNFNRFCKILPKDWQTEIEPYWEKEYKNNSKIYILEDENKIIGGGIVFSSVAPDMKYNIEKAKYWLEKGYLYIAFFFLNKKYRGNKLGDLWLKNIFELDKNQKYWLTIEDYGLENFYKRNGFKLIEKIPHGNSEDWLFISN